MINAIKTIEKYIEGMDHDLFLKDNKTIDAVIRQFEILGEAASRVPSTSNRVEVFMAIS